MKTEDFTPKKEQKRNNLRDIRLEKNPLELIPVNELK